MGGVSAQRTRGGHQGVGASERKAKHARSGGGTNFKLISPFTTRRCTWKRRACYCTNCTSTACTVVQRMNGKKKTGTRRKGTYLLEELVHRPTTIVYTSTPINQQITQAGSTCLKRAGALGASSNPRWLSSIIAIAEPAEPERLHSVLSCPRPRPPPLLLRPPLEAGLPFEVKDSVGDDRPCC